MLDLPTGTVTFLFTDIEGSTLLLQRLGADYAGLLADHHRLLRAAIQKWRGVEVDTQGDAFFVAFIRAADAVRAVQEMQYSLAAHTWPAQASVRVRMALHTGEPALTLMGYVGLDVHRAARICSAGYGGQVLLSAATQAIAAADLPEGASLRLLGAYRLKDLQRPEEIYQLVISGLPADFPPLKSLDLHPNNLPVQLTSFIGRAGEIALVEAALERSRLVTLTGPGGAGKTRLALQLGAELLDRYPDGIWFVELAPLSSPALVPQAVAAALKLPENPNLPLMETLCAALSPRSSLIILDNCEHLVQAAASLAEDLLRNCPHLTILATSREILNVPGEAAVAVPSLSLPAAGISLLPEALTQYEAVQLFIDRAIAAAFCSVTLKPGCQAMARSMNRRTDSYWVKASGERETPAAGRDNEGTAMTASPGRLRISRLVASILRCGQMRKRSPARRAAASTRCSQLSRMIRLVQGIRAAYSVSIRGRSWFSGNLSAAATA